MWVECICTLICDKFQIIGKGSYGLVIRARWKGRDVAIKVFQTEAERSAFKVGDRLIRTLFNLLNGKLLFAGDLTLKLRIDNCSKE